MLDVAKWQNQPDDGQRHGAQTPSSFIQIDSIKQRDVLQKDVKASWEDNLKLAS
jgi:hypothetical protein